jgi:hypothetical protein
MSGLLEIGQGWAIDEYRTPTATSLRRFRADDARVIIAVP